MPSGASATDRSVVFADDTVPPTRPTQEDAPALVSFQTNAVLDPVVVFTRDSAAGLVRLAAEKSPTTTTSPLAVAVIPFSVVEADAPPNTVDQTRLPLVSNLTTNESIVPSLVSVAPAKVIVAVKVPITYKLPAASCETPLIWVAPEATP